MFRRSHRATHHTHPCSHMHNSHTDKHTLNLFILPCRTRHGALHALNQTQVDPSLSVSTDLAMNHSLSATQCKCLVETHNLDWLIPLVDGNYFRELSASNKLKLQDWHGGGADRCLQPRNEILVPLRKAELWWGERVSRINLWVWRSLGSFVKL